MKSRAEQQGSELPYAPMLRSRQITRQQSVLLSFIAFLVPVSGDCTLKNGRQMNVRTSIHDLQVKLSQQTHGGTTAILVSGIGSVSVVIAPTSRSNFHAIPRSVRTTPIVLAYSRGVALRDADRSEAEATSSTRRP